MRDKKGEEEMFRFEKLDVWQKSMKWIDRVYSITAKFPAEERFGLTSQLRRSIISIAANIAEGSSRTSNKDFAHFIENCLRFPDGSGLRMHRGQAPGYINEARLKEIYKGAEELSRMSSGLRSYLLKTK